MDYVLPNESESNTREDIELSSYEFNFDACVQFGSNEGIYIDCSIYGKYTETEIKRWNADKGVMENEFRRSVGTFKTLRTDLEAMLIMGELCGALVYYAHQYVNENLDKYTPIKELEWHERYRNCNSARSDYINRLANDIVSANNLEPCNPCDESCTGKENGCLSGVKEFLIKEMGKDCSLRRYPNDERNQYYEFLDGKYNSEQDYFSKYVDILINNFSDLTLYKAAGYVFTWLCTRKQDFTGVQEET
jgi:hypothetical protein